MQLTSSPPRKARSHYRHDLRTLTYVTLDAANGGIVRNVNRNGAAIQAVASLRERQRVRVRFELKFPRVRIETYGHVSWSNPSGQCGIRFEDLPGKTTHLIDEWIFSNLLDNAGREAAVLEMYSQPSVPLQDSSEKNDGLNRSARPRAPIPIVSKNNFAAEEETSNPNGAEGVIDPARESGAEHWLYRPLSARTLARMVDGLVLVVALLLFALIFVSITHELPSWPITLGAVSSAAVFVAGAYWGLFAFLGGASVGARLTKSASTLTERDEGEELRKFRRSRLEL
jgi:PilZ domain/RDD family